MITGVWIKPGEDDLIVETKDEEEVEGTILHEVFCGRIVFIDGFDPDGWTRIFPPTGVHNQIVGSPGSGGVIQAANITGGIHIGHHH